MALLLCDPELAPNTLEPISVVFEQRTWVRPVCVIKHLIRLRLDLIRIKKSWTALFVLRIVVSLASGKVAAH